MSEEVTKPSQPTLLIIRDGWGANHNAEHDSYNAVKLAKTPVSDSLTKSVHVLNLSLMDQKSDFQKE